MKTDYLKLCLVTDFTATSFTEYQDFIQQVARSGITSVQLRAKKSNPVALLHYAQTLKNILTPLNVPLIINDHVDVALAVDAEGVHLGQGDISPAVARHLLGPNKIIGWSVETLEQVQQANELTAIDYLGASAVFTSITKLDCKTIWGLEGLKKLTAQSKHPVVGIGGIDLSNVADVIANGACGVAVIGAIHQHPNPASITAKLLDKINQTLTRQEYV